jgi:HlyD family secretion protein
MEVQTSVDEADIGKVTQGQRVEFTVDAYADMRFEGTVSQVRLQPVTTNNVVTYVVILSAPNPDKKLMPGMTASATIFVEEKKNTLTLSGKAVRFTPDQAYMMKMFAKMQANGSMPKMPAGAPVGAGMPNTASGQPIAGMPAGMPAGMTNSDPKTKTVWIKDEKMGLRPNIIKIGIDNGTSVEVISGLKEGDEVIISMGNSTAKTTAKKTDNGPPGGFPF